MSAEPISNYVEEESWYRLRNRRRNINLGKKYGETMHHPVGTCKMGNDTNAVVGANLKVHGLDGLRVADAL